MVLTVRSTLGADMPGGHCLGLDPRPLRPADLFASGSALGAALVTRTLSSAATFRWPGGRTKPCPGACGPPPSATPPCGHHLAHLDQHADPPTCSYPVQPNRLHDMRGDREQASPCPSAKRCRAGRLQQLHQTSYAVGLPNRVAHMTRGALDMSPTQARNSAHGETPLVPAYSIVLTRRHGPARRRAQLRGTWQARALGCAMSLNIPQGAAESLAYRSAMGLTSLVTYASSFHADRPTVSLTMCQCLLRFPTFVCLLQEVSRMSVDKTGHHRPPRRRPSRIILSSAPL
jgi:hypothetical protein